MEQSEIHRLVASLRYSSGAEEEMPKLRVARTVARLLSCAGSSRLFFFTALLLWSAGAQGQEQVIPLYPGVAPGSEGWTQQEGVITTLGITKVNRVRNVVRPTLTIYRPKTNANGTAVIVAPGGGFRFLTWGSEGTDVAQWLADRGITAFVLKYRLVDTGSTEQDFVSNLTAMAVSIKQRAKDIATALESESETATVVKLAAEDGRRAIALVRERAKEWNLAPDRIGILGFSAGAMITSAAALQHTAESRPDFAAPIYGPIDQIAVPQDAPPMFIVCAQDDPISAEASARLYLAWHAAGKPVELHAYSKGGHGFGMQRRGLPVDHWIERFADWLKVQGLTKP